MAAVEPEQPTTPEMPRWHPLRRSVRSNVGGAIYGLILAASIIAASSQNEGDVAALVDLYLVVTLVVFWAAHVYSHVLAKWIEDRNTPSWQLIRREMAYEWPMVSAPLVPALILLLAIVDVLDDRRAIDLALGFALAELMLTVVYAARSAGATTRETVVSAVVAIAFAATVVFLKVAIH